MEATRTTRKMKSRVKKSSWNYIKYKRFKLELAQYTRNGEHGSKRKELKIPPACSGDTRDDGFCDLPLTCFHAVLEFLASREGAVQEGQAQKPQQDPAPCTSAKQETGLGVAG